MKYTVHRPPADLSEYVEHLWTVEFDQGENPNLTLSFFVTCAPCIVFQHHNGRSAITGRTPSSLHEICTRNHPTSFIRGAITQPFKTATAGALTAIGVELRAHAVNALFRLDAAELRDRVVDLDRLSTDRVSEELVNTDNQQRRIGLLMQFLRARVGSVRGGDWLVMQSLRHIHGSAGSVKVRDLLKDLHVSERQFERRFERALGVSVKLYLRIARFHAAVRLMRDGQFDKLSDIAYDLGYADQSHFIKDIRQLTGATPKHLSHAVEKCAPTTLDRSLIRQRVLIQPQQPTNPYAGIAVANARAQNQGGS